MTAYAASAASEHKFSAPKIFSRLRQQNGHLDREDLLAVNILVQTIVVTLSILENQRGRPRLTRLMTPPDEVIVLLRIAYLNPHCAVPAIRDRHEVCIKGRSQFCDDLRQRVTKYLYSPRPKPCLAMTT